VAILLASVFLANLPALTHLVSTDPLPLRINLSLSTPQGMLMGMPSIDPNVGTTTQALGHLAAGDWLSGHVPWWNPYEGVGVPLAGDMISAALFPLVILLNLAGGELFFHIALELLAGLGTYFLARRLGLGISASLAAGIAFALNGTFSWLGDATVNPVPFLPLLILGVELTRGEEIAQRRWGGVLVGLSLALSIYGGFPETAAIDAVFVGLWFVLRLPGLTFDAGRRWFVRNVWGSALGLLLAAPLIVAFLDYIANGDVGAHGGNLYASIHLPSAGLSMLSMPYVFGGIFGLSQNDPTGTLGALWDNVGGYLTPSLVALAILAVVGGVALKRDRWLRIGLGAWIVLSLSTTFGIPVLGHVLELIPGVSHTAFYRYAPPSWELAAIILAAMAIDDLARSRATKQVVLTSTVITTAIVAASTVLALGLISQMVDAPHIHLYTYGSIGWAVIVSAAILLAADGRTPMADRLRASGGALLAAAVAVEVLAMFIIPQLSAPRTATADVKPIAYLQSHLGLQRFFTLGPLQPDYGAYYQISEANTLDLPIPERWAQYVGSSLAPNTNPIVFSGYQVNDPEGPSPWTQFVDHFKNYEQIGVKYLLLPTASAPSRIPASLNMHRVYHDAAVTIYQLPHPSPLFQAHAPGCLVRAMDATTVRVRCASATTIVWREMYFPGWTAEVGDHAAPISRTNAIFQSVRVPGGGSVVTFDYEPPYITLGVLGAVAGLILLGGEVGVILWSRRRKVRNAPATTCRPDSPA
jgi:hypothetical protein